MFRFMTGATMAHACVAALALTSVAPAGAQTWAGPYLGAAVGAGIQGNDRSEILTFDTNLDRAFTDTVRTATGADAFSPGFCGGIAMGALPAAGCTGDTDGLDAGGRFGYDWQNGKVVVGTLIDVSSADVMDGVSAFSTTPAFYAFSRELTYLAGLRARVGVGNDRVLVYGTGGGAWAGIDHRLTTSNGVNTFVPGKNTTQQRDQLGVSGWRGRGDSG